MLATKVKCANYFNLSFFILKKKIVLCFPVGVFIQHCHKLISIIDFTFSFCSVFFLVYAHHSGHKTKLYSFISISGNLLEFFERKTFTQKSSLNEQKLKNKNKAIKIHFYIEKCIFQYTKRINNDATPKNNDTSRPNRFC